MSRSERPLTALFELSLRLYPRPFRDRFRNEMVDAFRHGLRSKRRRGLRLAYCLRSFGDVARSAFDERRGVDAVSAGRPPRRPDKGDASMTHLLREVQHSIRQFVRTPLFSLAALAIVAVGIGANAAAFSFVNAFLLRPPVWHEPERVVNVYQDSDDGDPNSTSFPAYRDMARETSVFSAVTASSPTGMSWENGGETRQAAVEFVTASFLDVFGLKPFLGSWFGPEHDHVGAGTAAVVSYSTWQNDLGADPGVVGKTATLNGEPVTILGVGPRRFPGSMMPLVTDFWLSISSVALGGEFRVGNLERRQDHWYDVKARLAPGVTPEAAQAAMDLLAQRLEREFPELNTNRDITVFAYGDVRIHPDADRGLMPAAAAILGLVGVVLLLACSNLANLLLVRGMSRMPEVAMRRALGASQTQIARTFLVESLLLAVAGGLLGILLARWLLGFAPLLPLPAPMPGDIDLTLDVRVLLFTFGLVLVTGCFFALAPALRAISLDPVRVLHEGSRSASQSRRTAFVRNALVAAQAAASIVLVVLCALLFRDLVAVSSSGAGVDAERVVYAEIDIGPTGLEGDEAFLLFEEIEERGRTLAGVEEAALTSRLPANGRSGSTTTVIEDYVPPSGTGAVELPFGVVGDRYFQAVGQPLLEGRVFTAQDGFDAPRVAVVNETAARRYWGEENAIGRRLRSQSVPDNWVEVVGVVGDAKVRSLGEGPTPMMYRPIRQARFSQSLLVLRTAGAAEPLVTSLAGEITAVRQGIEVGRHGVLEDFIRAGLAGPRAIALTIGVFAALALLLASMGIYAMVSFGVARRTSELGIRIALGAAASSVIATVVREVMVAVGVGAVLGLGASALIAAQLQGTLSGVGSFDLPSFLGGSLVLAAAAALAAYLPARRAAAANPVDALRAD